MPEGVEHLERIRGARPVPVRAFLPLMPEGVEHRWGPMIDPAREDHQQKLPGVENGTHGAPVRKLSETKTTASDPGLLLSTARNESPLKARMWSQDARRLMFARFLTVWRGRLVAGPAASAWLFRLRNLSYHKELCQEF